MVHRVAGNRRALILIPCSSSKTQPRAPAPGAEPLEGLSGMREALLSKLGPMRDLNELPANRKGVGDPSPPAVPAIDLYSGKLHTAASRSLRAVADGAHPDVEVLIVSAIYGLVRLTEPIRQYDLTMADPIGDGRRVFQYWTDAGLCNVLEAHIEEEGITNVWSLLPDSAPSSSQRGSPYHRVFKPSWSRLGTGVPVCLRVMPTGAANATGRRRGRWFDHVLDRMPDHLTAEAPAEREVGDLLDFPVTYRRC